MRNLSHDDGIPVDEAPHPSTVRTVNFGAGAQAFVAMRDQTAEMCTLGSRTPLESFRSTTSGLPLGQGILFEHRTSEVSYQRTMLHIARSSLDHYLVTLYLTGQSRIEFGSRFVSIRPGDIAISDMSVPSQTLVGPTPGRQESHGVTFMLPRGLLAPFLAAPDSIPAVVIPGDESYGHILRDHILSIRQHGAGLMPSATAPMLQTVAQLVAGGLRPAPGRESEIAAAEASARYVAIKHHIERTLDASTVDVDAICHAFGVSRAALYRLFEAEGGVVHFARRLQLRRAFAAVISPAHRHLRISELALDHGFSNESAFIRSFRREFGMTPGELRRAQTAIPLRGDWMTLIRNLDVPYSRPS